MGHLFEAIGKNRQADHNKEYGKQLSGIAHMSDLCNAKRSKGNHAHVECIYQAYSDKSHILAYPHKKSPKLKILQKIFWG